MRRDTDKGRYYEITISDEETGAEKTVLLPSVTNILSTVLGKGQHLTNWAVRLACEHVQMNLKVGETVSAERLAALLEEAKLRHQVVVGEANELGSQVHALVEERLRSGRLPRLVGRDQRVVRCAQALSTWLDEHPMQVVEVERMVFSLEHGGYAGTLDCAAFSPEGQFVVLDWKTRSSRFLPPEYALQAAAYAKAYEQMHPAVTVDDILIVSVSKADASILVRHIQAGEEMDRLFSLFLAVRRLFDWKVSEAETGAPVRPAPGPRHCKS